LNEALVLPALKRVTESKLFHRTLKRAFSSA
jgi:hypothetical protein